MNKSPLSRINETAIAPVFHGEKNMTTKPKHTPGPWKTTVINRFTHNVCFDHGSGLCEIARAEAIETREGQELITADQAKANARLIAAAPDLLEALKMLRDEPNLQCETIDGEMLDTFLDRVIAKAEGRTA